MSRPQKGLLPTCSPTLLTRARLALGRPLLDDAATATGSTKGRAEYATQGSNSGPAGPRQNPRREDPRPLLPATHTFGPRLLTARCSRCETSAASSLRTPRLSLSLTLTLTLSLTLTLTLTPTLTLTLALTLTLTLTRRVRPRSRP